jgi:hypothetical protein
MVRKQIYISKRQEQLLKRLSQARQVSEAELIRQAIDRETMSDASTLPLADEETWQQAVAFMRSLRTRAAQFSQPYQWNRAELYEERLKRYEIKDRPETQPDDSSAREKPE